MDIRETSFLIVGGGAVGSDVAARLHERGAGDKSHFLDLLADGREIAEANGAVVDKLQTWAYRHAPSLEASPVQAPPRTRDRGGAGLEAVHFLARMASQTHARSAFMKALEVANERNRTEAPDVGVTTRSP